MTLNGVMAINYFTEFGVFSNT